MLRALCISSRVPDILPDLLVALYFLKLSPSTPCLATIFGEACYRNDVTLPIINKYMYIINIYI